MSKTEYHREWRKNNPEKARAAVDKYRSSEKGQLATRARHLRTKYNLSIEDYESLLADQRGRCAVCLGEMKPPCIDHNHDSGRVRGLLCRTCNAGIGQLRDDAGTLMRAVTYLQRVDRSELVSPLALIGSAPEHREFYANPDAVAYYPEIHPSARINAFVTVDSGFERPTSIGANVLLMTKSHIGHDAVISDGCEIAPHTSVGGYVVLGRNVKVGQSAVFKPYVKVGDGARIGMGAVVTKDVPAGETWVGNPAKPLVRPETDDDMWLRQYEQARA